MNNQHQFIAIALAVSVTMMGLVIAPSFGVDQASETGTPSESITAEREAVKPLAQVRPEHHIQVQKESLPIGSSRLASQYSAYRLTIQNSWDKPIDIMNAQIVGGTGGQQAYSMVKKSSAGVWGSVLGVGFVLSIVTFGISFVAALVAWPIIAGVNASKNGKARKEANGYQDVVPLGLLNAGESTQVATLVPLNQKPVLKITFRDMEGHLYSVSQ